MKIPEATFRNPPDEVVLLDAREVVEFLRRNLTVIGVVTAFAVVLFMWFLMQATPIYSASTQLLLEVPRENVFGSDRVITQGTLGSEIVDSQMAVLRSRSLLRQVVESHNLADDPDFHAPTENWVGSVRRTIASSFSFTATTDSSEDGDNAEFDRGAAIVELLRDAVDVSRVGSSNVIDVRVQFVDPAKAATLADAVAQAYVAEQVETRLERARRASAWLNERMDILQRQLADSEAAVEKFKFEHNLLSTRDGSITEQQLSELNLALITARADTAETRSRYEQVQKLLQAGGDVQTIPDVLKSTLVSELRIRHAELVRSEADLSAKYGDRHPDVTKVRIERTEIERQISDEITRVIGTLRNEFEVARSREASLQESLRSVSGQSVIDNQETVKLRELERIAAANRHIYESFLARARLAQAEEALLFAEARVISPASMPESPIYPRKKLFTAIGLIFGLGLGIGTAAVMELGRPGFTAPEQVEQTLHIPVLASIPKVAVWNGRASDSPTRIVDDVREQKSLCYQQAIERIALGVDAMNLLNGKGKKRRAGAIQVTSAMAGEGKTVLAVSLAVAAAAAGNRVLLIDADLRRSAISDLFQMGQETGLVDILGFAEDPANAIHLDERTGVYLLPAGARSDNPAPLLGSARMRSLLQQARRSFDTVVIDTPPVTAAIDAEVVIQHVQRLIFTVKWNDTARESVVQALRGISRKGRAVDVVLTMVDERQLHRYSRYTATDARWGEYYHFSPSV